MKKKIKIPDVTSNKFMDLILKFNQSRTFNIINSHPKVFITILILTGIIIMILLFTILFQIKI
jgi:hypothetical protein